MSEEDDDLVLLPPTAVDSLAGSGLTLAGSCLILLSSTSLLMEWSEDRYSSTFHLVEDRLLILFW